MTHDETLAMLAGGTITVAVAVQRYGYPRSSLYAAMARREIAFTRAGRRRLIVERSLLEWLSRHLVPPDR